MNRLYCATLLCVVPLSLFIMLLLCIAQGVHKQRYDRILPDMRDECREHGQGAVKLIEGVFR